MVIERKHSFFVITAVFIGCIAMYIVDAIIAPNYVIKSIIKIFLFLILPFLCAKKINGLQIKQLFIFPKKHLLFLLLVGIGIYTMMIGAYFVLERFLDLSRVTIELQTNEGIGPITFIIAAVYIAFINSLLEEFFFRGFAFLTLKRFTKRNIAYLFSALSFALYHVAIMIGWFSSVLTILFIVALFVAGLLFNFLNEKFESIYASWVIHICANFAINTIGIRLFYG